MIGRALPREIERDLEAEPLGLAAESLEVVERAERRDRSAVCPPSREPIAHGLPGSPGPATSALLRPFLKLVPIG